MMYKHVTLQIAVHKFNSKLPLKFSIPARQFNWRTLNGLFDFLTLNIQFVIILLLEGTFQIVNPFIVEL